MFRKRKWIEISFRSSNGGLLKKVGSIAMNKTHSKFDFLKVINSMRTSVKSLLKPPNVPSASRILSSMSADDIYPIGVKWNPFLALGFTQKNSSPPPFFKKARPVFS